MNTALINNLPIKTQKEVLETLKAFDEVTVIFEYGEYHVSTGVALKKTYGADNKTIGKFKVTDIYTEEEIIENYIETFHSYPGWYKGERDYIALRKRFGEY